MGNILRQFEYECTAAYIELACVVALRKRGNATVVKGKARTFAKDFTIYNSLRDRV
jgi:hypothetical protein